jgi:hypothetical protein
MATTKIRNIAPGARGLRGSDGRLVMIEPGETVELELSSSDRKDAEGSGYFAFGGDADALEQADETDDLSKLTNKQLHAIADAEGVPVETDDNKADLVRKIEEARAAVS